MNLRQQLRQAAPERETVITIGVFDGVHRGHAYLLQRLSQRARPDFLPAALTFSNHPVSVLQPGRAVSFLTTPEQKARLLAEQGIALVVSLEFTPALAQLTAQEFVELLVTELRMKGLVIGPDFALGRRREGNADFLRDLGRAWGFWVETLEPLLLDGTLVKSRAIRQAITDGEVAAAARLLGRDYSLVGRVAAGDRRGRELGFPTANLDIAPEMALPGDGIYAAWAIVDGSPRPAAASIGVRPTFGLTERLVEVYILDFAGDLYGQELETRFVAKLRNQETFPNLESLVAQINRDVNDTRLTLAAAGGSYGP